MNATQRSSSRPSPPWADPTCEERLEPTGLRRVAGATDPTITVVNGLEAGRIETVGPELTIGRSAANGLCLPDPGISRLHARLVREGDMVAIEDLGSRNGTFLDGVGLRPSRRVPLEPNTHVTLGCHVTLRFARLCADEQHLAHELYDAARRDVLTRAFNRRTFFQRLGAEMSQSRCTSIVVFDLDHFKRINDAGGHAAGDAVLREVARVARLVLRSQDMLARVGGEEFALILTGAALGEARTCAERLRTCIAALDVPFAGRTFRVTLSAGVACSIEGTPDGQALYQLADTRLYAAKERGRNRVMGP